MSLSLEQVKDKIQNELNALVLDMGYVSQDNKPLIYFHGEVSNYDDYSWIKSINIAALDEAVRYLPITPFALILEKSTPSSGELIEERVDEYSVYFYIRTRDKDIVQALMEAYIMQENYEGNLSQYLDVKILKHLTDFSIGDEDLQGSPDGEGRRQVTLSITYDMFEARLLTSKDYVVKVDGQLVPYVSFRFEKSNMVIPNVANTSTGTSLSGIAVANEMGTLHEYSLVIDFYIDKTSTPIQKMMSEMASINKVNTKYQVEIYDSSKNVLDFFETLNIQGFKFTNVLPQISTLTVTFGLAYSRMGLKIKKSGDALFEDLPILTGKISHLPALKTATYMGDNASKSTIVGLSKSVSILVPIIRGSSVITMIVEETLKAVYSNKYTLQVVFLGITKEYEMVLADSSIDVKDAAYETMSLTFVEAK